VEKQRGSQVRNTMQLIKVFTSHESSEMCNASLLVQPHAVADGAEHVSAHSAAGGGDRGPAEAARAQGRAAAGEGRDHRGAEEQVLDIQIGGSFSSLNCKLCNMLQDGRTAHGAGEFAATAGRPADHAPVDPGTARQVSSFLATANICTSLQICISRLAGYVYLHSHRNATFAGSSWRRSCTT